MNKIIISFVFGIIIFLYFLLSYLFFNLNIPLFPKDYSVITFLISFLNLLFGTSIVFGFFRWKIDREDHLMDTFLEKIDKILSELNNIKYTGSIIKKNTFHKISFQEGVLDISILGERCHTIEYEKVDKQILCLSFELMSLININKILLRKERYNFVRNIISSKLMSVGNIKYFIFLFMIHTIFENAYFDSSEKGKVLIKKEKDVLYVTHILSMLHELENLKII